MEREAEAGLLEGTEPSGVLAIRVRRDGTIEVAYNGEPVPVSAIDVDPLSLRRLEKMRRLLR